MGPLALLPIRRKVCCGLLSPLKSIASAGFEPATLASSDKHINHYITEATITFEQTGNYLRPPESEQTPITRWFRYRVVSGKV
jgi:hypothetical protein